jgi:hypothetical protein
MATAAPSEYQAGLAAIQRRREIAQAMQAQALSPLSAPVSGTGNYPIQTKISPLRVLAQLGQAYVAKKQNERADKDYGELAKAMASNRSKALAALIPQDMAPAGPATSSDEGPTHAPMPMRQQISPQAIQDASDAGVDEAAINTAIKNRSPITVAHDARLVDPQSFATLSDNSNSELDQRRLQLASDRLDEERRRTELMANRPPPGQKSPDKFDHGSAENTAQMIANGQIPMISGVAMRSSWGQQVVKRVKELKGDYNAADFKSNEAALKNFTSGKNGNTVRSLNVAVQHLDQLGGLATALNNGDMQGVNKIGNWWAKQTGGPAPTNFEAAKKVVADEIVKAIVGSGGGVADREEAANSISAAQSPQQLAGVINTYQGLMTGQLNGIRQQYKNATGRDDFENMLLPETRAKLEAHNAPPPAQLPPKNAKGWVLHVDAQGNKAYVGPNNEIEEVQ